jgi:catechol 2,3-dioxygenase-like lactoylglutathione lyase family enzyme
VIWCRAAAWASVAKSGGPAGGGGKVRARPARDLARSTRFYRDLVGLPSLGGFENHDGYDGVFFALPGGAELELTAGPARPAPSTDEDLLVLYVQTPAQVAAIGARLTAAGVTRIPNRNPYWNRSGLTFLDPDGYRLVIAAAPGTSGGLEGQGQVVVDQADGDRAFADG